MSNHHSLCKILTHGLVRLILIVYFNANGQFLEVSEDAGIEHNCLDLDLMAGGVTFFDFNNDGFEDIYLIGGSAPDKLYENQGDGTFRNVAQTLGISVIDDVKTMGVASGDFDNDGYSDLFVTSFPGDRCYLFWNRKGIFFEEGGNEAGISENFFGSSIALADYDLDGNLDIYVGNYNAGSPGNFLYRNNGDKTFSNAGAIFGTKGEGAALAVAFSDCDLDGDSDILVGNDFGFLFEPNKLFINNYPEIGFSDISEDTSWDIEINSMGIAIGDFDQDGDFDYYVSDIDDNFLFVKQNDMSFQEMAHSTGIANEEGTSWGTAFFDYDNDAYLDLFVSNGPIGLNQGVDHENKLFKGNGVTFEDVSLQQNLASKFVSRGMAAGDYNNDGQMDLVVGVVSDQPESNAHTLLHKNENPESNWIKLKLQGNAGNRDGYGSRVRIVSDDGSRISEVSGGGSYLSQNSKTVHFGLGTLDKIDSLIVTWPGGKKEIFKDLAANQTYLISEFKEIFKMRSDYQLICSSDMIFLEGKFRNQEGIYIDTLSIAGGIREIVKTRLSINESNESDCLPTGIGNEVGQEDYLKIWPNPFYDGIRFTIDKIHSTFLGEIEFVIFDGTGKIVLEGRGKQNKDNSINIDGLDGLPSGFYLLTVTQNNKVYQKKIIRR